MKPKVANRKTAISSARERKIQEIVRQMCTGVWGPAQRIALQQQWHCSNDMMKHYAAEGSRVLRLLVSMDKEEIRTIIGLGFNAVIAGALKDHKWRDAAAALHLQGELWGVNAPQQLDIRTELETLTPAELQAKKKEILAKLQAETTSTVESLQ